MKRKSKAYITIYALYMIFVLMIVIAFLIVQVKNIRTVNAYKYDYIQAKAIAYSKVRIIHIIVSFQIFHRIVQIA